MGGIVSQFRKVWFQIRWLLMSREDRYVYLWNRTNPRRRY